MNPARVIKSCLAALFAGSLLLGACQSSTSAPTKTTEPRDIHTAHYDLLLPAEQDLSRPGGKALLILFPSFGDKAADTRTESKIPDAAVKAGIVVMLMDFNAHILMSEGEMTAMRSTIDSAITAYGLNARNTFIGGFSAGGNVTMLLTKSLVAEPDPLLTVKGIFAVDAPLDLSLLYEANKRKLERPIFPEYKSEAEWVVSYLDSVLGDPATDSLVYETRSPLRPTQASVLPLKDLPVRLYTEPDTTWWRVKRGEPYEDLNSYAFERIHGALVAVGNERAELILTKDRGIQHGQQHPHAWSIVDEQELVKWMLKLAE